MSNGGWQPYADVALRELHGQLTEEVLDEVVREEELEGAEPSLPDGSAGRVLAALFLAGHLNRPELTGWGQRGWQSTIQSASERHLLAALHGGVSGVAWVDAFLGARLGQDPEDSCHGEVESALVSFLSQGGGDRGYDLISGWVGIGVYALERWPAGESSRILELVLEKLLDQAVRTADGVTWITAPGSLLVPAVETPRGHLNLGIAHGIPGIIAFLGRASSRGLLKQIGRSTLEGAVSWLLAQRHPLGNGLSFTYGLPVSGFFDPSQHPVPRLAWCYGDLGVAAALHLAGTCHGRTDWRDAALGLARNCARLTYEESGVGDHCVCHGSVGNAHVFGRLWNMTGDDECGSAARRWLGYALRSRIEGSGVAGFTRIKPMNPAESDATKRNYQYVRDTGFLMGGAGVALALASAFTRVEPSWDRVLLLSD